MNLRKRIEPHTWAFVEKLQKAGGKPIYDLPVQAGRAIFDKLQEMPAEFQDISIQNHMIHRDKGDVSIRIARPRNAKEPLPVVMYYAMKAKHMSTSSTQQVFQ